MSGAGKRWRVERRDFVDYGFSRTEWLVLEENGYAGKFCNEADAISVVADHNARLDAEPAPARPPTDDDARRFLANHPEIDGLDDVIAALLGARAERDEAMQGIADLRAQRDRIIATAEARATAAEAALATAKRDAWIAGRDAAAQRVFNEYGLHQDKRWAGRVADYINALTPPDEAEGGRQDG